MPTPSCRSGMPVLRSLARNKHPKNVVAHNNGLRLVGQLFAVVGQTAPGERYWFSPINNIEAELGNIGSTIYGY